MYGGKLRKVKFKYSGLSIENVLDKLPTAKILNEKDGIYTIRAEGYGEGFKSHGKPNKAYCGKFPYINQEFIDEIRCSKALIWSGFK